MRIFQVVSRAPHRNGAGRAEWASARWKYASFLIVVLSYVSAPAVDRSCSQETPLERGRIKPVFRESFTDGSLDTMRYEPAYGSREQFNTYIQPGAIFLGQENATENTEQQVNYYPKSNDPAIGTVTVLLFTFGSHPSEEGKK